MNQFDFELRLTDREAGAVLRVLLHGRQHAGRYSRIALDDVVERIRHRRDDARAARRRAERRLEKLDHWIAAR